MEMHEKIRAGRLRLGESEEAFGRRFGVTRATVQQWERPGGTAPKLERIVDVADVLGLSGVLFSMSTATQDVAFCCAVAICCN